jgi:hypothetical protein
VITVTENQLRAINFLATSPLQAVQMVRAKITEDDVHVVGHKGVELINRLLGTNLTSSDLIGEIKIDPSLHDDFELMTTQAVAETVLKNIGTPIDEVLTVQAAKDRVMRLLTSPEHHWMFAKPQSTADAGEQKAVVEGVDVKVAVKADGKIKKGGKETLSSTERSTTTKRSSRSSSRSSACRRPVQRRTTTT